MVARAFFWLGFLVVLFTGLFNIGIIGIDDYNNGFSLIPRAPSQFGDLAVGVFPVLPKYIFIALGAGSRFLGATDPVWQIRLTLAFLGVFSFLAHSWAARRFFPMGAAQAIALFFVGFYFVLPLFYSRPMNESLCMPLLTLSAVLGAGYGQSGRVRLLVGAAALLTLASLMRFQAGVCGLALLFVTRSRKLWLLAMVFLAFFGLSGLLDLGVRGEFHGTLRAYVSYNLSHSGEHYGRMPFYTFALLLIGLSLPPTFFARYPGFHWKKNYRHLMVPLLYVFFFVFAHTFSPHKEERFLVPVLPLFLFCLVPMALFLWNQPGQGWRRRWFLALNGILLFLVCTNPPQNNLIAMARWISAHPEIRKVTEIEGSLVFFPEAFIGRKIEWNRSTFKTYRASGRDEVAILRCGTAPPPEWQGVYRRIATFQPGRLERLLVLTNAKNARRGCLSTFQLER